MDTKGVLTGIVVASHNEPYGDFSVDRPEFAAQFKGKSIRDPFRVGADIDAVSRATITITSAARAIRISARRMATQLLAPPAPANEILAGWAGIVSRGARVVPIAGDDGPAEAGRYRYVPRSVHAQTTTPDDGGWNFEDEEEPVETWQHLVRSQAVDIGLFAAFAALALTSFFRKSVKLKYVTLVAAVAYLGVYKSQLLSIVNIFGLMGGNLPIFKHNLGWYFFALFSVVTTVLFGTAVLRARVRVRRADAAARSDCAGPVSLRRASAHRAARVEDQIRHPRGGA